MKLLLAIVVLAAIAGSIFADYGWRRWMMARKAERESRVEAPGAPRK